MATTGVIRGIKLSGVACAVPENIVNNEGFKVAFGDEQVLKFEKMAGVVERRLSSDPVTTCTLAVAAAKKLEAAGRFVCNDVDAIIFVSQTPNLILPATACLIHEQLAVKKDCVAYDINLGCSGFVYGVFAASSLLKMPGIQKVLLCGGDTLSRLVDSKDSASAPLFGDAGFAMLLERDELAPEIRYAFKTDGIGHGAIACAFGGRLKMDGVDVFNFTINEVPDLIKEQITSAGLTAGAIDYLVLHQANKFILKQIAMMTGFSMKKVPVSLDRYGNTSSASIPLTLCDLAARESGTKKIVMSGFGVGLSWGTLITDFDFSRCIPLEA